MLTAKTNDLLDTLISQMATALIDGAVNLHDERQVLRALVAAGFQASDAIALGDQVIVTARAKQGAAT